MNKNSDFIKAIEKSLIIPEAEKMKSLKPAEHEFSKEYKKEIAKAKKTADKKIGKRNISFYYKISSCIAAAIVLTGVLTFTANEKLRNSLNNWNAGKEFLAPTEEMTVPPEDTDIITTAPDDSGYSADITVFSPPVTDPAESGRSSTEIKTTLRTDAGQGGNIAKPSGTTVTRSSGIRKTTAKNTTRHINLTTQTNKKTTALTIKNTTTKYLYTSGQPAATTKYEEGLTPGVPAETTHGDTTVNTPGTTHAVAVTTRKTIGTTILPVTTNAKVTTFNTDHTMEPPTMAATTTTTTITTTTTVTTTSSFRLSKPEYNHSSETQTTIKIYK